MRGITSRRIPAQIAFFIDVFVGFVAQIAVHLVHHPFIPQLALAHMALWVKIISHVLLVQFVLVPHAPGFLFRVSHAFRLIIRENRAMSVLTALLVSRGVGSYLRIWCKSRFAVHVAGFGDNLRSRLRHGLIHWQIGLLWGML